MPNQSDILKAVTIYENGERGINHDEMDIDYSLIEKKVLELNEMGIDITLEEIGNIIESKFSGKQENPDLRRFDNGKLMYPQYTLLRYKTIQ